MIGVFVSRISFRQCCQGGDLAFKNQCNVRFFPNHHNALDPGLAGHRFHALPEPQVRLAALALEFATARLRPTHLALFLLEFLQVVQEVFQDQSA